MAHCRHITIVARSFPTTVLLSQSLLQELYSPLGTIAFMITSSATPKDISATYAMKCILDVGSCVTLHHIRDKRNVFPDEVFSRWPVNCPAYAGGLKKLLTRTYKGKYMKTDLKQKLLMHVHFVVSKKLGGNPPHSLPSTLAQLCWQKRQVNSQRHKHTKKRRM